MNEFADKKASTGIWYSEYAMTFMNVVITLGTPLDLNKFRDWLSSEGCSGEEIAEIMKFSIAPNIDLLKSVFEFITKPKTIES